MSHRTNALLAAVCLFAAPAFGGTVADFVEHSLYLNLGSVQFGTAASKDFGPTDTPMIPLHTEDAALSWKTNTLSGEYHARFPERTLSFGFRNGKLTTVHIRLNAFTGSQVSPGGNSSDTEAHRQEAFNKLRLEFVRIQDEMQKVNPTHESHQLFGTDTAYQMEYGASCGPEPESLFDMEFEFAPKSTK